MSPQACIGRMAPQPGDQRPTWPRSPRAAASILVHPSASSLLFQYCLLNNHWEREQKIRIDKDTHVHLHTSSLPRGLFRQSKFDHVCDLSQSLM